MFDASADVRIKGEKMEARKDEVLSLAQVRQKMLAVLHKMRATDGMGPEDARLLELSARESKDEIERAALFFRAMDVQPRASGIGRLEVQAHKAMERVVVESCRKLVLDVWGSPDVMDADLEIIFPEMEVAA